MSLQAVFENAVQRQLLSAVWSAAGGLEPDLELVQFLGAGELPSIYELTSFASASVAAVGLAQFSLRRAQGWSTAPGGAGAPVRVARDGVSRWFRSSVRPQGWSLPPAWDAVAGDYRSGDGWIRLHTNAPHHRSAALSVLKGAADREAVAAAVSAWRAEDLEQAVVEAGGCAAAMRSWAEWQEHPQGRAVLTEPLLDWQPGSASARADWDCVPERPLQGLRVLDMTRVLAGPVATRVLAGLGAEVLRIDPPAWDEPSLTPEVTLGKRCARLDLNSAADLARWEVLLQGADVLVHGYRSDALESLGLGWQRRQQLRPGLVDVSLDAYGFTGPWSRRRGFDSLVQMSMGIAEAGQRAARADSPQPLPVQALDHATGYLLACAVLRGLEQRWRGGQGCRVRASLARTGALLMGVPRADTAPLQPLPPESSQDWSAELEATSWGPARRLRWPLAVAGVRVEWPQAAGALGRAEPVWLP